MNNTGLYLELREAHRKISDLGTVIFGLAIEVDKEIKKGEDDKTRSLKWWTEQIHELAKEKGWWETERNVPEMLALIHSEVSEALEEYRNNSPLSGSFGAVIRKSSHGKPEGFPIELADIIIRILDLCCRYNIDIEEMIRVKHEYNKTREYRHGGKAI